MCSPSLVTRRYFDGMGALPQHLPSLNPPGSFEVRVWTTGSWVWSLSGLPHSLSISPYCCLQHVARHGMWVLPSDSTFSPDTYITSVCELARVAGNATHPQDRPFLPGFIYLPT